MDDSPSITHVHKFDPLFPLPYRIALEILVGIWGWGLNVHVLDAIHVDLAYILRYQTGRSLHKSVYQFALGLTVAYTVSILIYWRGLSGSLATLTAQNGDESAEHPPIQRSDFLPWATFVGMLAICLYPGHRFHPNGRGRVLSVLKRIIIGGLNTEHRLPDILLADALTSYAKVFVDIGIMTCMFVGRKSCLGIPDRSCGGQYLVPLISSIPFLIRLRQCIIDYWVSGSKIHLYNCAKYGSSIPVILLSALQRKFIMNNSAAAVKTEGSSEIETIFEFGSDYLRSMWLLALLINSAYSFIWDVTFDWELELLTTWPWKWSRQQKNGGLRPVLYFRSKFWYYGAIALDYILRFTWGLKLSSHWYHVSDYESGLFVLGLLEIIRRWVWVFFRIEAEWVKSLRDPYKGHELPTLETTMKLSHSNPPLAEEDRPVT